MTPVDSAPSSPAGPVLEVRNLDFSYGRLQILFDVSLEVHRGQALALLGTNGAGKSTLLRVIAGLGTPAAGSVVFEGRDISGRPAEDLARDGLVLIPGGKAVFADMSVAENLEMQSVAVCHERATFKERMGLVLDSFPRLAERSSQPAGRLSGGEQQQLALARALMVEPRLLCIDELSLGLAPVVVGELMEIVRNINRRGVTVIVVEQSLNIAASLCARAVFLEKGQVRFSGSTSDLLEDGDIARAVFLGGKAQNGKSPGEVASRSRRSRSREGTRQVNGSISTPRKRGSQ